MKYKDNLNRCRNENLNCKVPWVLVVVFSSFYMFAVRDTACF